MMPDLSFLVGVLGGKGPTVAGAISRLENSCLTSRD